MDALITTFTGNLNGESQPLVNARDLHQLLGSKQDFTNWIKNRIEKYRFIEGNDYSINLSNRSFGFGKPKTEYHITTYMAEHIAMVDETDIGFKVRDYFRDMMRLAQRDVPTFLRKPMPSIEPSAVEKLQALVLKAKPDWRKIVHYYKLGLTQKEIAKLVELAPPYLRTQLLLLAELGLIDYQKNQAKSLAGTKGLAIAKANHQARMAVQHVQH